MPYIKVYIHYVWSTKNRVPFLNTAELRNLMWKHIFDNARSKNIYIDSVNGYDNHCHCLISLGSNQTLEKVAQLIKGESSYWFKEEVDLFIKKYNFKIVKDL